MTAKTILVVEDDQDLRESLVEILQDKGFTVNGCDSAEAALEHIKSTPPLLAIVDNMMPGMGGMALMPLLKNYFPNIRIIMITAFSTVENAVAAMKNGADDYLSKPFRREELLAAIRCNFEELKFSRQLSEPVMDVTLACLANQIRRQILVALAEEKHIRFMNLTRSLGISDHTKVNFHLKKLKMNNLISQDREKAYRLTPEGEKMVDCLQLLSKRISL